MHQKDESLQSKTYKKTKLPIHQENITTSKMNPIMAMTGSVQKEKERRFAKQETAALFAVLIETLFLCTIPFLLWTNSLTWWFVAIMSFYYAPAANSFQI